MPISRREFCGAVGASLAAANADLFADDQKPKPLRVIAYNIFKLTGWPHQRNLAQQAVVKGQMAKRLAMELALHDPDSDVIVDLAMHPGVRVIDRYTYYRTIQPEVSKVYSAEDALLLSIRNGHHGPWDESEQLKE